MTEREIRETVARGVHQYWDDAGQQQVAFNRWKDRGFEGECPQISKGSIVDYVVRAFGEAEDKS